MYAKTSRSPAEVDAVTIGVEVAEVASLVVLVLVPLRGDAVTLEEVERGAGAVAVDRERQRPVIVEAGGGGVEHDLLQVQRDAALARAAGLDVERRVGQQVLRMEEEDVAVGAEFRERRPEGDLRDRRDFDVAAVLLHRAVEADVGALVVLRR